MLRTYLRIIWRRPAVWATLLAVVPVSQIYPSSVPNYNPTGYLEILVSPLLTAFLASALIGLITIPEIFGSGLSQWRLISRLPPRQPMRPLGELALAWLLSSALILAIVIGITLLAPGKARSFVETAPNAIKFALFSASALCLQFFLFAAVATLFALLGSWGTAVIVLGGLFFAESMSQTSIWYSTFGPDFLTPLTLLESNVGVSQALWGLVHASCWALAAFLMSSMQLLCKTGES